jgi:hypothetical protein
MESVTFKFLPIFDTSKVSVVKPSRPPPPLPHLKKLGVAFNFDTVVDHRWIRAVLQTQFSKYHGRGILAIDLGNQGAIGIASIPGINRLGI